jgi:AbrB family looped-hinge helix DNA binding protein
MPTVTIKGQVTIPKEIREAMGIKPGMKVNFKLENGKCVLTKQVEKDPFGKWSGFLGIDKSTDEIIEELRGKAE